MIHYEASIFDAFTLLYDPEAPPLPLWFTLSWCSVGGLILTLALILG
jgi:hypothetical protein